MSVRCSTLESSTLGVAAADVDDSRDTTTACAPNIIVILLEGVADDDERTVIM